MTLKGHFQKAEQLESKLTPEFIDHLTGLSSPKIWHLLNNLASESENYLEIGTYLGSSLMAALEGNSHLQATAVDNFCMKPNLRNHFFQNMKPYKFTFIEVDAFTITFGDTQKFGLYFYDGRHEFDDQYQALVHFLPAMKDEFIYICDDWNNAPVREATMKAIRDLNLQIIEHEERIDTTMKDKAGWWCGISVFKLKKNENKN